MVRRMDHPEQAACMLENWQETILWSCQQQVMGELFGKYEDEERPQAVMALLGDFCFLAGQPDRELIRFRPHGWQNRFLIMVPENEAWASLIEEQYRECAKRSVRYATKKEGDVFNRKELQAAVDSLSPEYNIRMVDEALYHWCREHDWSRDLVWNYESYEKYQRWGLGAMVLKDGVPVSGASSYSSYRGGIEIEIDTRKEFRRRGLAYAAGAKLILACLERGWYPSWDAQNLGSLALAEKLGYHFDCEYPVYEI